MHVTPWNDSFGCIVSADSNADLLALPTASLKALMRQYGAVHFQGYNLNLEIFREFTDRFSHRHLTHMTPWLRHSLVEDHTIVTVVPGEAAVPLHGEMFYRPLHPDLLWFYCLEAETIGGETLLCEGEGLLSALFPATRKLFESQRLRYVHVKNEQQWKAGLRVDTMEEAVNFLRREGFSHVQPFPDGRIEFHHVASAIHLERFERRSTFVNSILSAGSRYGTIRVFLESGEKIADDVLREISSKGEKLARPITLRRNELILIDNSRFLHGRNAFSGKRSVATRLSLLNQSDINDTQSLPKQGMKAVLTTGLSGK